MLCEEVCEQVRRGHFWHLGYPGQSDACMDEMEAHLAGCYACTEVLVAEVWRHSGGGRDRWRLRGHVV